MYYCMNCTNKIYICYAKPEDQFVDVYAEIRKMPTMILQVEGPRKHQKLYFLQTNWKICISCLPASLRKYSRVNQMIEMASILARVGLSARLPSSSEISY